MKTLEQFEKFVYNDLDPKAKGNRVLTKEVIQNIHKANPKCVGDLDNIKGFPKGGAKHTKYADAILKFFLSTSKFS